MSQVIAKVIAPGGIMLKDDGDFSPAFSPADVIDLDSDIVRRHLPTLRVRPE